MHQTANTTDNTLTSTQSLTGLATLLKGLIVEAERSGLEVLIADAHYVPVHLLDIPHSIAAFTHPHAQLPYGLTIALLRDGQVIERPAEYTRLGNWWAQHGGAWGGRLGHVDLFLPPRCAPPRGTDQ